MTRFVVAFLASILVLAPRADAADGARKPNVILIVADDLGYADVGYHNQSKDVKTPNIDAMAAEGVRFTSAYVSSPVCSPMRAGLLTGRYQQRFGFEWNPKGPKEETIFGLPLDQVLLPQLLKQSGYATGMFGKWHLGHNKGMLPHERGFDEFFGFAGGAHRYVKLAEIEKGTNGLQRNGTRVAEEQYLTDALTREACSFIERHKADPFFIYLPYNAPHSPMQAPPRYLKRFAGVKDEQRRAFLAMLSAMDDGVGAVMSKLRDLDLERHTLVIFVSDNGGPTPGNTSLNDPFRGRKGQTFEGGIRVPLAMHWKGRLPAGKVENRMVVQLDIVPTILAAASSPVPSELRLDGVNLLPFLAGEQSVAGPIHETLYWRFGPWRAIRSGNWKLHWPGEAQPPRLHDLEKDVSESTDVAAAHPEVVDRLTAAYNAWSATLQAPRWPGRLEGGTGPDAVSAAGAASAVPTR